ncbi:hypothetical protein JTB14_005802 [Gonioctena quinquepunctata]|nr:hypothetical protein JTB14_005802 [Gonioctena quinquepunctata]
MTQRTKSVSTVDETIIETIINRMMPKLTEKFNEGIERLEKNIDSMEENMNGIVSRLEGLVENMKISIIDLEKTKDKNDLKFKKKIETIRDSVMLQKDLQYVCEWSCKNKRFFNLKKCSVMRITKLREPIIFDYMMQEEGLQSIREMRDLGITYDDRLSFSNHVKNIIKSANRMLGFIVRQT